jgi:hypothetical protein
MRAIPTFYAGVRFRSRLEARWAAFFDEIAIEWDYEPIDLDGYIPDFIVEKTLLVEVKPITEWPCAATCSCCDRAEYDAAIRKILASGWTGPALLVGAIMPSDGIGRLIDGDIAELRVCSRCLRGQGPRLIINSTCLCGAPAAHAIKADPFWKNAGNKVQWRAPRRSHAIERHVPSSLLEIANARSVAAERPSGFCSRCGCPTGIEAPGEMVGDQLLHTDRVRCDHWLNGEAPCS